MDQPGRTSRIRSGIKFRNNTKGTNSGTRGRLRQPESSRKSATFPGPTRLPRSRDKCTDWRERRVRRTSRQNMEARDSVTRRMVGHAEARMERRVSVYLDVIASKGAVKYLARVRVGWLRL